MKFIVWLVIIILVVLAFRGFLFRGRDEPAIPEWPNEKIINEVAPNAKTLIVYPAEGKG